MKKLLKVLGIASIFAAVLGFGFVACDNGSGGGSGEGNADPTPPSGSIIKFFDSKADYSPSALVSDDVKDLITVTNITTNTMDNVSFAEGYPKKDTASKSDGSFSITGAAFKFGSTLQKAGEILGVSFKITPVKSATLKSMSVSMGQTGAKDMEYFVKIGDDTPISLGTGNGGPLGTKSLGNKVITEETTVKLYFNCTKAPTAAKTWNPVIADLIIDLTAEQGAPAVASVELSESSKTIATSETFDLTATVLPDNAEDKTVTWSIVEGDDKVTLSATTGNTVTVTGAAAGEAKVRATAGEKTADCIVTVMDAANSVKVTVKVDGTEVTGSPFTLEKGEHDVADLCELINVDPEEISEVDPAPDNGKYNFTDDTTIAITLRKLESITIKKSDDVKNVYYIGEEFDPTGLVITATYDSKNSDNKTKDITVTADNKAEFTANGFDSSAAVASQDVTITWSEKTTTDAVTVEIKSYGNVPYVTTKTDSNNAIVTDLAALTNTSNAWYGYVKGKTAYTATSNVNEADDVVSVVDGGTQAMAYYVLPTAVTTDTTITGKVTPKTQKSSWTFLQLVDVDDTELIGLRTTGTVKNSSTDMTAAIRTDASTVGTVTQTITKDVEYDFTINYAATNGLVEIILQADGGSALKLPAQKFTDANGIKAVKIFGNSSSVSIKNVTVTSVTSSEATAISIAEGEELELEVGDETSLTAIVEPIFADMASLAWSSDATGVATVGASDGKVTAVAPGTANITATLGSKTATVAVTVKEKLDTVSWFTENVNVTGTVVGTFLTAEDATYSGSGTKADDCPKWAKSGETTGFYYQAANANKQEDWIVLTLKVKASVAGKLKKFSYIADSSQQQITTTASYKVNSGTEVPWNMQTASAQGKAINAVFDMTSFPALNADDEVTFIIKIGVKDTPNGKGTSKLVLKDIVIGGVAD